jgi:hypothetical protein
MREPMTGVVHSFEIVTDADGAAGQLVTYVAGEFTSFAGDRNLISALKSRLDSDHPSVADVETAALAIATRRGETLVRCDCDACVVVVEEDR